MPNRCENRRRHLYGNGDERNFGTLEFGIIGTWRPCKYRAFYDYEWRLDGHIVQGHVDQTARCTAMEDADGSTYFMFEYEFSKELASRGYFTVDKGSVTVNGVSLTVCEPTENTFKVAIIPYTRENTNFAYIEPGSIVNLEFDILGKYIARLQRLTSY